MKKIKLLISLLTLGTLVGVLSSCNENTPTSIIQNADSIVVTAPEGDVVVGSVLNLDDYVKIIVGGKAVNASYGALLTTPNTATLDGKKLTITAEGVVNVKITCGDKTARLYLQSISSVRAKLKAQIEAAGKTYYVDNIVESGSTYQLTGKGSIHNNLYFASCYDPALLGDLYDGRWQGLLKTHKGYTYQFEMSDRTGANLNIYPGVVDDLTLYYTNAPLPLDASKFTTNSDGSLVTYNEESANLWIYASNGILPGPSEYPGVTGAGLKIEYKDILGFNGETLEDVMIVTTFMYGNVGGNTYTQTNPYKYFENAVLLDKEYCSVKAINDYIDSRREPAKIEATALKEKFNEFITSKTYSMDSALSWKHANGTEYETIPYDALPVLKGQTYTTADGIWIDGGEEFGYSGIIKKETGLYSVSNVPEEEDATELLDHAVVSKIEGAENVDVWGGAFDSFLISSLAKPMNNLNIMFSESANGVTTYEVGLTLSEDFYQACISLIPVYGPSLYDFMLQQGILSYFSLTITVAESYINFDISAPFDNDTFYHIEHRIYDLGVDKIADKISGLTFA